jgi:hypothetical protein
MKTLLRASFTALIVLAAGLAQADTSLTAYGSYWDADTSGTGAGLQLKKTFLAFGAVELSGGYVDFNDINTEMIPLEVAINARLPFFISPYAGVGAGYYIFNTDISGLDDNPGTFAQLGIEATFLMVGLMAEVRYNDLDGTYFDGTSYNAGILLKW